MERLSFKIAASVEATTLIKYSYRNRREGMKRGTYTHAYITPKEKIGMEIRSLLRVCVRLKYSAQEVSLEYKREQAGVGKRDTHRYYRGDRRAKVSFFFCQ